MYPIFFSQTLLIWVIYEIFQPAYPIPGMRPPLGGAGHVVPGPKGSGTMGIVMPLYTVGIVVFFVYTIMKVKKKTKKKH